MPEYSFKKFTFLYLSFIQHRHIFGTGITLAILMGPKRSFNKRKQDG